jgi:signal transduction histidine kinase
MGAEPGVNGDTHVPQQLLAALERLRPSDHLCITYHRQEDRFAATVPFVRIGLERGERCVYVPDGDRGEALQAAMQSAGMDVGAALRSGAFSILDKNESYLPDGRFDAERMFDWLGRLARESVQRGFQALRFLGEAMSVFTQIPGMDRYAEYEARLNPFLGHQPALLVCLYNHYRFPPEIVRSVLETHPLVVLHGTQVCRNPYYVPPEELLSRDWPQRELDWILENIAHLQDAEDTLQGSEERYRMLSGRMLEVQERERQSLARELHDQIGQDLAAIRIDLQTIHDRVRSSNVAAKLDEGLGAVGRTIEKVQKLALELRPALLDDLGLVTALRWLLDQHGERAGYRIGFSAEPPEVRLPPEVEIACFRIVQEALTNVDLHARARNVAVSLRYDDRGLTLSIRDDGAGFDPGELRSRRSPGANLGLLGMEERALLAGGTLELHSAPDQGTTVEVRFPRQ